MQSCLLNRVTFLQVPPPIYQQSTFLKDEVLRCQVYWDGSPPYSGQVKVYRDPTGSLFQPPGGHCYMVGEHHPKVLTNIDLGSR